MSTLLTNLGRMKRSYSHLLGAETAATATSPTIIEEGTVDPMAETAASRLTTPWEGPWERDETRYRMSEEEKFWTIGHPDVSEMPFLETSSWIEPLARFLSRVPSRARQRQQTRPTFLVEDCKAEGSLVAFKVVLEEVVVAVAGQVAVALVVVAAAAAAVEDQVVQGPVDQVEAQLLGLPAHQGPKLLPLCAQPDTQRLHGQPEVQELHGHP